MAHDNKLVQSGGASFALSEMAPRGVDGRVWAKVLKDQLLSSKGSEVTDEELLYFAQVCKSTGLDPSKREIYGIFRNNKQKDGTYKKKLSIQTAIDGFRVAAERSGQFGGSAEPEFVYDKDVMISVNDRGTSKTVPNVAKVTVKKVMKDRVIETTRTARWADYYPGEGTDGQMWRRYPEVMLAKVAEAQALRAAFPNCAELYVVEEMTETPDVTAGVDMAKVAEAIKNATSLDDLLSIVTGLNTEQQKQVATLASEQAAKLSEKEAENATPATDA